MKVSVVNSYSELNKNQCMFYSKGNLGIDLFRPLREFKKKMSERGVLVFSPENVSAAAQSELVIFLDCPSKNSDSFSDLIHFDVPKILIQGELPAWKFNSDSLESSSILLTYDPDKWDRQKAFRYHYSVDTTQRYYSSSEDILSRQERFCMLSTNHKNHFEGELYSARRSFAKLIDSRNSEHLILGGRGWEDEGLSSVGVVDDKVAFLKQGQFNVCFENSSLQKGWITEKLLEAILVGSIPIYYSTGHDLNILPSDIYINAANFNSWDELYDYCLSLDSSQRVSVVEAGWDWLTSGEGQFFTLEKSVDTLIEAFNASQS
jgi:hypothetical protein